MLDYGHNVTNNVPLYGADKAVKVILDSISHLKLYE